MLSHRVVLAVNHCSGHAERQTYVICDTRTTHCKMQELTFSSPIADASSNVVGILRFFRKVLLISSLTGSRPRCKTRPKAFEEREREQREREREIQSELASAACQVKALVSRSRTDPGLKRHHVDIVLVHQFLSIMLCFLLERHQGE